MAVPFLAVLVFCWLLMKMADIDVGHMFFLPIIFWMSCLVVLGVKSATVLFFPIFLLYLATPVWDYITPILQNIVVYIAVSVLAWMDIPIYFQGVRILIPAGVIEVSGSCSGLKLLLSSMSVSAIFCKINNVKRINAVFCILLLGVFFGLLTNWVRVISLIMIGHATDLKHSLMNDHIFYGWILFSVFCMASIHLADRVLDYFPSENCSSLYVNNDRQSHSVKLLLFVSFIVCSAPAYDYYVRKHTPLPEFNSVDMIWPRHQNGWMIRRSEEVYIRPKLTGEDFSISLLFSKRAHEFNVQICRYVNQGQGKELINIHNKIYNDDEFRLINNEYLPDLSAQKMVLVSKLNGMNFVVWYWYEVDGKRTVSEKVAKLLLAKSRLAGSSESTLIYMTKSCSSPDCGKSNEVLSSAFRDVLKIYDDVF
jgi:EpsI family protein